MIIAREKWTQGTVNETRRQDLVVGSAAFTLGETARETACGRIFFLVVTLEGHEVSAGDSVFGATDCGEQHRVVHAQHDSTVGLFGQLTSLDADGSSIRQRDGLSNHVHRLFFLYDLFL